MPVPSPKRTRTVSSRWNAVSVYVDMVRHDGGHRGLRPGHADQGMTRELGRASSASCLENADHARGSTSPGVHRDTKAPTTERPVTPPGRSFENAEMTGTRGQASTAKEPGMGVRHS